MGKKGSIAFGVLGIVLVVVAIVWWVAIGPAMIKLPSDLNSPMTFQGNLTQYIDSATQQSLPAGQEKVIPFTAVRTFSSLADLYTSSVAVCKDSTIMTVGGQAQPPQVFYDPLDRKTRKYVKSDQSWAYDKARRSLRPPLPRWPQGRGHCLGLFRRHQLGVRSAGC